MIDAAILLKLTGLGLTSEQYAGVLEVIAVATASTLSSTDILADRREKDRIRKRNSRVKSNDASEDMSADRAGQVASEPSPAPAPLPEKEIPPPAPPLKKNKPSPDPTLFNDDGGRAKRGTRLTEGWLLPKPWGDWAIEQFPFLSHADVVAIADEFRDYWIGVPGAKGCKANWEATWRNRVREKAPRAGRTRAWPPLRGVAAERERLRQEIEDEQRQQGETDKNLGPPGGVSLIGWREPEQSH